MFNRGVKRVRELLEENNNPEPQFNVNLITVFQVVVSLATDEGEQILPVKDDKKDILKDVLRGLSDRQRVIIESLSNNPLITAKEMSEKTGVTDRTIRREIENLKQLGVSITRDGGRKQGKWVIKIENK